RPDAGDALSRAANWLAGEPRSSEPLSLKSCALRQVARDPVDVERERRASAVFDRVEKACPRFFRGQSSVTEPFGSGWSRFYNGLDARLVAYGDELVLDRYRAGERVSFGPAALPPVCR
ncbi:MAG TPA: hypothetical protein VEU32_06085, partial [Burkholderiales bacterium]|nr:hypothetical protein [Burkholderiales bacterium]